MNLKKLWHNLKLLTQSRRENKQKNNSDWDGEEDEYKWMLEAEKQVEEFQKKYTSLYPDVMKYYQTRAGSLWWEVCEHARSGAKDRPYSKEKLSNALSSACYDWDV